MFNFLVHFSLYFNGLLTAKLLSHPMIMAETILLVMNVCRKYEVTSYLLSDVALNRHTNVNVLMSSGVCIFQYAVII